MNIKKNNHNNRVYINLQCSCTLLEDDGQHHHENVTLLRWPPTLPPIWGLEEEKKEMR